MRGTGISPLFPVPSRRKRIRLKICFLACSVVPVRMLAKSREGVRKEISDMGFLSAGMLQRIAYA